MNHMSLQRIWPIFQQTSDTTRSVLIVQPLIWQELLVLAPKWIVLKKESLLPRVPFPFPLSLHPTASYTNGTTSQHIIPYPPHWRLIEQLEQIPPQSFSILDSLQ